MFVLKKNIRCNMTDLEFQLQGEISDLRATINGLRSELKQREEAYNELQGMFEDCHHQLSESLKREEIATKIINEKRNEINKKYYEHDRQLVVDFMDYLANRGFFCDDLCFDCEHQAFTYLELRERNNK